MGVLKILGMTAALVAIAALPASVGTSAPLRLAANSVTFEDSTGEVGEGADITSVVASNTNAGLITFRINVPNRPTLAEDLSLDVFVDADNNASTGAPDLLGVDYVIQLFRSQLDLFRWDGTDFTRTATDPPQASLVFSYAAGAAIKISAAELGNTTRLNFFTDAVSGIKFGQNDDPDFTDAKFDFAPDPGHGLWSYEVKTAPLKLLAKKFTAGKPRAGALYTVRLVAARNDTGAVLESGQVRCKASIGGKRLKARAQRFVNKEARCTWLIPSTARGRTLRGSAGVAFEGKRLVKAFSKSIG